VSARLAVLLVAVALHAAGRAPESAPTPANVIAPTNASAVANTLTAPAAGASKNGDQIGFWNGKATDWAIVILTGGLLLVGGTQAIIYRRQARLMSAALRATSRSNRVAARAATVAEDALKHAERASETELRAYLHVSALVAKYDPDGVPIEIETTICNYGRTPAMNVSYWQGTCVRAVRAPDHLFGHPDPAMDLSRAILPPNGQLKLSNPVGPLHPPEVEAWRLGQAAAYAWGEIVYDDWFGSRRVTAFKYFTVESTAPGALSPYLTGNHAT
jgi:hypothetical protein